MGESLQQRKQSDTTLTFCWMCDRPANGNAIDNSGLMIGSAIAVNPTDSCRVYHKLLRYLTQSGDRLMNPNTGSDERLMASQSRELVLYVTADDACPFEDWLETLRDRQARVRIKKRLDRIEQGNLGDFKLVGEGVMEFWIDYGPGYRLYFAQAGTTIILLLCGGDKSTQNQDILRAKQYWTDFQKR